MPIMGRVILRHACLGCGGGTMTEPVADSRPTARGRCNPRYRSLPILWCSADVHSIAGGCNLAAVGHDGWELGCTATRHLDLVRHPRRDSNCTPKTRPKPPEEPLDPDSHLSAHCWTSLLTSNRRSRVSASLSAIRLATNRPDSKYTRFCGGRSAGASVMHDVN